VSHHEVERSFALGPEDDLPDLGSVPGVASVGAPDEARLVAAYVDTDDLALVRAGVTLRRREGGADAGWHLKVPAGGGRDEVHRPLGRPPSVGPAGSGRVHVPAALLEAVRGWTRGRRLGVVAVVETQRTTRLLHDESGAVLAEVADDRVVGTVTGAGSGAASGTGSGPAWREVEVELVSADTDFLDEVAEVLAGAGIEPSREQRKIGTVLGSRLAELDALAPPPGRVGGKRPVGRLVHHRLRELVAELGDADCDVRRGVDGGVHRLRVTSRRLRALLATYRPLVDRAVTDPLREELRWVARTLGEVRDAEVVREHLRVAVDAEPPALVLGPVRRRLETTYRARVRDGERHARKVLASRRYLRLRDDLDHLAASPPLTEEGLRPAREVVPGLLARDLRRVRRRMDVVLHPPEDLDPEVELDRDAALHDVRSAAKRLRYAAETARAVGGSTGRDAKDLRRAARALASVLGEHHDTVVAREELRRLARAADRARESSFTFGLLHARQAAHALALEGEIELAGDHLSRVGADVRS